MVLSVIIVNYNVKYFLEYCLVSVVDAMKNIEGEIFVVDNNSTDGSKEFFCTKFPQVNFTWNSNNEGFAKANNKASLQASGDYILFLNPDTIVGEDSLEKCIAFIRSKNNQIACGVKMIDGSGRFLKESKRAFPGPLTSLFKLSGLATLFPKSKIFSRYHLGFLDENLNHEVDVLAGAFMMLPREIAKAVGGFDENFFMYGEDIDLSYRIQQAGFKNFYFAETSIIHFKGESTRKGSLNYVKMFYNAMSIFVKKHYGGAKAGLFNLLIQLAIFLRAALAAIARILKWVGLPVIDAAIILMSFWIVKYFWSTFIKQEVNYSPNMLIIAFPAFTILFLLSSYFAGLYDGNYKQSRLNRCTVTAILILLAAYSLLPETLRFSRGILLFGSLTAFLLMTVVRWLLLKWNVIESENSGDKAEQTLIVGSEDEFNDVTFLLERAGLHERVLGRIDPGKTKVPNTIGSFDNIKTVTQEYPVKEIIFCKGDLPFKSIIEILPKLRPRIRKKFYASGTDFMIGSAGQNAAGSYVSDEALYRLNKPLARRNKMLADVTLSLFFIITFPFHFVLKSQPIAFYKNVFAVLFQRRTWIGYAIAEQNLPQLKPAVLTTTGLPAELNTLPDNILRSGDDAYAKNFNVFNDIKTLWLNYKLLSH